MHNYDPELPPNPAEWLALDEQFRIHLAEVYHRKAREKVPNLKAHTVFHAIVENQIAEGLEPVVRAMARAARRSARRGFVRRRPPLRSHEQQRRRLWEYRASALRRGGRAAYCTGVEAQV
jgi:hypothetical protein